MQAKRTLVKTRLSGRRKRESDRESERRGYLQTMWGGGEITKGEGLEAKSCKYEIQEAEKMKM